MTSFGSISIDSQNEPPEREDENRPVIFNSNSSKSISLQRSLLPIFDHKLELLYLLENYPTTIIVGSTGCGKSTQIPQYLVEAGWAANGMQIACTQPRRIAAVTVAERVAVEMGCQLGEQVGYSIRFDSKEGDKTSIKYLTEGVLIREMMLDPLLSKYSVVMVDEAHERSINTDILLGLLKKIQLKRKDLRLIISSATVDAEEFQIYFNENREGSKLPDKTNWINKELKDCAAILGIEGRLHPVDNFYLETPTPDYIKSSLQTIFEIHQRFPMTMNLKRTMKETNFPASTSSQSVPPTPTGSDILVFLTGQDEIELLCRMITETALREEQKNPNEFEPLLPLPMFSSLPFDQQMKVFQPTSRLGTRKVIVSTNVCETSVTVEGIGFVIDCGFAKIRSFDPKTNQESLRVSPISKSSANQRAGRAGRTGPGLCFRLYTEQTFLTQMEAKSIPEIQRSNPSSVILQLKALGIDNLLKFDFMTPPPSSLVANSLEQLYVLKAIDSAAKLTDPIGLAMAELPLDPFQSKSLISSYSYDCFDSMVTIIALLSVPSIFVHPKGTEKKALTMKRKYCVKEGDHLSLLNIYNAFVDSGYDKKWCQQHYMSYKILGRAVDVRHQLKKMVQRLHPLIKNVEISAAKASTKDSEDQRIRKCLLEGYFINVAKLENDGQSYRSIIGRSQLHLHPSSILFATTPKWIMYHEVVETSKVFMRDASEIDPKWLLEIAPHYYQPQTRSTIF